MDHKSALLQVTLEEILKHVGTEVPDVGMRVNGRATGVEGEIPFIAGTGLDHL
jgi:hypothetical protein